MKQPKKRRRHNMRNYNGYVTAAFTAGIPAELMNTIRPWVENHYAVQYPDEEIGVTNDLGYAELADITTVEEAFNRIKTSIKMATEEDTIAKTKRARNKFFKDAGGRVGKGVYRLALKGYYLFK